MAPSRSPSDFGPFEAVFGPDLAYLSLLGMRKGKAERACKDILGLIESNGNTSHYIRLMLEDINWRPHMVAFVAALTSEDRGEYVEPMWAAFDAGSWVAPQLAVVLSFCDPDFERNAKQRILSGCKVAPSAGLDSIERHSATGPAGTTARSGKNMTSLMEVLAAEGIDADWVSEARKKPKTRELLDEDFDDSARIVRNWMNSVREALAPLGVSL